MDPFGRFFDFLGAVEVGQMVIVEVESVEYSKDDSKLFFLFVGSLA
jgi:hypothetical protein